MRRTPANVLALTAPLVVSTACTLFMFGCGGAESRKITPTSPTVSSPASQPQPTRIIGRITDRAGRGLQDGVVEILTGSQPGRMARADETGRFELAGSAPTDTDRSWVTIRVSRDGFQPRTTTAWWYTSGTSGDEQIFWLDAGPPIPLDPKPYTLTIAFDLATASSWLPEAPCPGFPVNLPRTFPVTVTTPPTRPSDDFRLVNLPAINKALGGFGLTIVGRFIDFEFDFPIEETIPDFGSLQITGVAPTMEPATVTNSSVAIPFHGNFKYFGVGGSHACQSDQAMMTFTPR